MTKFLLIFAASACFAQTHKVIISPSTTAVGDIGLRGLTGSNEVQLAAPDTVSATFKIRLPGSLPPTGGSTLFVSDTGVGSWASGAFVDLTNNQNPINGNKGWFGVQTFKNTIYLENPALGGLNLLTADVNGFVWKRGINGSGLMGNPQRVNIWQYSGLFSEGGSVSVLSGNAGSEVAQASMSAITGFDTTIGYKVNGIAAIDSSRNIGTTSNRIPNYYGENMTLYDTSGNIRAQIAPTGLNWYDTGGFGRLTFSVTSGGSPYGYIGVSSTAGLSTIDNNGINSFTYKVSGTTVIDASRNATIQNLTIGGTCTGCPGAITNYWTTNSTQSGMTGDKTTSGAFTISNNNLTTRGNEYVKNHSSGANLLEVDTVTGSGVNVYRMSNASPLGNGLRIKLWQYSGFFNEYGSIATYTGTAGSESVVNSMGHAGIYTSVGYSANGNAGLSSTITVKNSSGANCTITHVFGIFTGSTC